ncbi:MAG TPA: ABC transporter permease [Armatimonadota bacterium]|nr:ABC transporter permease [Armatimonadota bacterium]
MGTRSAMADRLHLWSPVLVKELRTRMRGARPAWLQAGYVFAMMVVMGFAYAASAGLSVNPYGPMGFQLGRTLYKAILITQAVLVALIVPGLTAGAVSSELEQKTYDMLASTRLRSRQVVLGKLLSAWLFAALLLTTSLPLAALCLLFGGVSPAEVLWSYGLAALTALLLAAIGLWWSSLVARSLVAVVGAYATMGAFMIGSAVLIILPNPMLGSSYPPGPSVFAALNPVAAVFYATETPPVYGHPTPAGAAAAVLLVLTALLLAAAASQRLPLLGRRCGIKVRGLMLVLFVIFTALAVGNLGEGLRASHAPADVRRSIGVAFFALITLVMALTPVIAVGEINDPPREGFARWLAGGLSPRRWLQPQVRSAFPFLALLALAGGGIILGGLRYFVPALTAAGLRPLWGMIILTIAATFGLSMVGMWMALAMPGFRGRVTVAVGIVITYLVTLVVAGGAAAAAASGAPMPGAALVHLNPAVAALYLAGVFASIKGVHLYSSLRSAVTVTSGIYIAAGLVGLAGAGTSFRRRRRKAADGDQG